MVAGSNGLCLRVIVRSPPSDPHAAFGIQDKAGELAAPVGRSPDGATFEVEVGIAPGSAHGDDLLRGPFVHGKPGSRFLYVSFAVRGGAGWARRIKVPLGAITAAMIAEARDAVLQTELDGRQSARVKATWRPVPGR